MILLVRRGRFGGPPQVFVSLPGSSRHPGSDARHLSFPGAVDIEYRYSEMVQRRQRLRLHHSRHRRQRSLLRISRRSRATATRACAKIRRCPLTSRPAPRATRLRISSRSTSKKRAAPWPGQPGFCLHDGKCPPFSVRYRTHSRPSRAKEARYEHDHHEGWNAFRRATSASRTFSETDLQEGSSRRDSA